MVSGHPHDHFCDHFCDHFHGFRSVINVKTKLYAQWYISSLVHFQSEEKQAGERERVTGGGDYIYSILYIKFIYIIIYINYIKQ